MRKFKTYALGSKTPSFKYCFAFGGQGLAKGAGHANDVQQNSFLKTEVLIHNCSQEKSTGVELSIGNYFSGCASIHEVKSDVWPGNIHLTSSAWVKNRLR